MRTFSEFIVEDTAPVVAKKPKKQPWEMSRGKFFRTHTEEKPGSSRHEEGKRIDSLPDHRSMWVFHATDKGDLAQKWAKHGLNPAKKPSNAARRNFEQGKDAEYAPGRGLSAGTYVGSTPQGVSGYGRHLVALRVKKKHLHSSPEQEHLGYKKGGEALANDDATIHHRVHPKDVVYMGNFRHYPKDAHHEFVRHAVENGHKVPRHVLKDYPHLAK